MYNLVPNCHPILIGLEQAFDYKGKAKPGTFRDERGQFLVNVKNPSQEGEVNSTTKIALGYIWVG